MKRLKPAKVTAILSFILLVTAGCRKSESPVLDPPVISTVEVFSISSNAITIKSTILSEEEVPLLEQGVYWGIAPNLSMNDNKVGGNMSDDVMYCRVEMLQPGTKYYVKVFAKNERGIRFGEEIEFVTNSTISDIDGNGYNTVTLGTQVWMVENLKTVRYNDGTEIPAANETTDWESFEGPAYSWYNHSMAVEDLYGALYNWEVVKSGKLCPAGWRIPTDEEWQTLIDYCGGEQIAASFLKKTGADWDTPENATNYSGFCALPGGTSSAVLGSFSGEGMLGAWWTSTIDYSYDVNEGRFLVRKMINQNSAVEKDGGLERGGYLNFLSVRCIKE